MCVCVKKTLLCTFYCSILASGLNLSAQFSKRIRPTNAILRKFTVTAFHGLVEMKVEYGVRDWVFESSREQKKACCKIHVGVVW